jgi:putative DNA primase/helicase
MKADNIMGGLAVKNKLWEGGTHPIGRRTSKSFTVRGARFTYGLQVQPDVIREFQEKNGGLARGIGYWARFLITEPESTQGTRLYREPPKNTPKLSRLHARLFELLEMEPVFGEHGGLEPRRLKFSPDGKRAWIEVHDAIEVKLGRGGDFYDVKDVASKAADNIARIAGLFHILDHGPDGDVSAENVRRAAVIVDNHLNEARRFFADFAASPEERDAAKLEEWLIKTALEQGTGRISRREADRGVFRARGGKRLDDAIKALTKAGRARLTKKTIEVRPELVRRQ